MTASVRALPNAFTWRLVLAFAVATMALGIAKGFTVHHHSLVIGGGLLVVMASLSRFYTTYRPEPQFAYPTALVAYFLATGLVFGPMSYFAASLNLPLTDAALARFDRAIGFDWAAVHGFVAAHASLDNVSRFVYSSSGIQMFVAWGILAYTGQIGRLSIFLTALTIAAGTVILAAGLLPAAGGYVHYGMSSGHGPGVSYLSDFYALRDGSMRAIDLSKLDGICQFPSFHTVVAVLSGWSLMKMPRWIGWPFAAYAAFVVFTTMPIGGHHFADVLAGGLITVAAIAMAWRIEPQTVAGRSPSVPAAASAG